MYEKYHVPENMHIMLLKIFYFFFVFKPVPRYINTIYCLSNIQRPDNTLFVKIYQCDRYLVHSYNIDSQINKVCIQTRMKQLF